MFTGLIEGCGTVREIRPEGNGMTLVLEVPQIFLDTESTQPSQLGDSVAINGCCLTVVNMNDAAWEFQAGEETLSRTNLGDLKVGSIVNVERAMPANGRYGGHFVQGHVDGTGQVAAIDQDGEWIKMWFTAPIDLARIMVVKGSITVDGISLTLVDVEEDRFSVALIPHTLAVTTLGQVQVGSSVNLETDLLGKYVEKLLAGHPAVNENGQTSE